MYKPIEAFVYCKFYNKIFLTFYNFIKESLTVELKIRQMSWLRNIRQMTGLKSIYLLVGAARDRETTFIEVNAIEEETNSSLMKFVSHIILPMTRS